MPRIPLPALFYAEDYHQQYLSKNPLGHCGLLAPVATSGDFNDLSNKPLVCR